MNNCNFVILFENCLQGKVLKVNCSDKFKFFSHFEKKLKFLIQQRFTAAARHFHKMTLVIDMPELRVRRTLNDEMVKLLAKVFRVFYHFIVSAAAAAAVRCSQWWERFLRVWKLHIQNKKVFFIPRTDSFSVSTFYSFKFTRKVYSFLVSCFFLEMIPLERRMEVGRRGKSERNAQCTQCTKREKCHQLLNRISGGKQIFHWANGRIRKRESDSIQWNRAERGGGKKV